MPYGPKNSRSKYDCKICKHNRFFKTADNKRIDYCIKYNEYKALTERRCDYFEPQEKA